MLLIVRRQASYPEARPDNGGDQENSNVTSLGQFGIPLKNHLTAELSGPPEADPPAASGWIPPTLCDDVIGYPGRPTKIDLLIETVQYFLLV